MTIEDVVRVEMFRANTYLNTLKRLARYFGGENGRTIVANINDANERIMRYEDGVRRKQV